MVIRVKNNHRRIVTATFLRTFVGMIVKKDGLQCMHPFTSAILRWFEGHGRELPWRGIGDPYAIWLSEVILQQTRVSQGWDYWERFIHRWPSVERLAQADEDEVMREWQGLGYYSRARNLHHAARQVVEMGGFPRTFEGLRQLKGVGDYTAAAIASFAFGQPVAVVDGNVYRVLARHFGIDTPINSTEGKKEFALLAQQLLPGKRAADFNQAMMDFGAGMCTPKAPGCRECPLQDTCRAWNENKVEVLPVKQRKHKVKERKMTFIYVACKGETAIRRRGDGDIWQGLWEPWLVEGDGVSTTLAECRGNEKAGGRLTLLAKEVKHVLTHRIIKADLYYYEVEEKPEMPEGYLWIPEMQIDRYAVPRLVEFFLQTIGEWRNTVHDGGGNTLVDKD